ncbi:hypothetical protein [Marinimicrobium sp. ABcell2]|uniref:hypothetical protein n=1 Tax=Marinimicrobium sp. ABcell2 TaxID=3069751 RepID=UPI0027B7A348|nr:hypothetical protein [Marinimicrobium sp. ABcell2]MDQ2077720.1 hypothetical protein [Marinimicrobium sp. ABcell2]
MFGQRRIPRHLLLDETGQRSAFWQRLGVIILIASLGFGAGLSLADARPGWSVECMRTLD